MGIFSKKTAAPKRFSSDVRIEIIDSLQFPQSGTFRGYKRFRLTTYQEPGVEEGLRALSSAGSYDLKGRTISIIRKRVSGASTSPFEVAEIFVDNNKVGCIYDHNDACGGLFSAPFDKVHVRIEDDTVYLFSHFF